MLTETARMNGIVSTREILLPRSIASFDGGEYPVRGKWSFAETNSYSVINCICNGGNACGQGTFARLFRSKWTFGIDALDDVADDLW